MKRLILLIAANWALLFAAVCFADFTNAGVQVTSARIWPAEDYTRLVLESRAPIRYEFFSIQDPARLVLDLHDVAAGNLLKDLASNLSAEDPYISLIRSG